LELARKLFNSFGFRTFQFWTSLGFRDTDLGFSTSYCVCS
jgi:hypothetical protein